MLYESVQEKTGARKPCCRKEASIAIPVRMLKTTGSALIDSAEKSGTQINIDAQLPGISCIW